MLQKYNNKLVKITDIIFYKNNIEQFILATYQLINDFTEDNNEKEVLENKIKEITKEIDQYSKAIAKGLISEWIEIAKLPKSSYYEWKIKLENPTDKDKEVKCEIKKSSSNGTGCRNTYW